MMRFPLYKRIPERVLHEILIIFVGCFPSAVSIQAVNVNTRVGNGRGQGDLFPSTHWSVVVAAGESQAEPEIAQAALGSFARPIGRRFTVSCAAAGTPWKMRKISHRAFSPT